MARHAPTLLRKHRETCPDFPCPCFRAQRVAVVHDQYDDPTTSVKPVEFRHDSAARRTTSLSEDQQDLAPGKIVQSNFASFYARELEVWGFRAAFESTPPQTAGRCCL
jgi:hypothetical protein